jgi:threonine-phosphate decarboxylase
MSLLHDHGGAVFSLARTLGLPSSAITDFSASINPLGMAPLAREALSGLLDELVHYPDTSHDPLKQALARHHGLLPGNFAIANGSTELIYQLPSLLPGSRALLVAPAFSEYRRALERHGWEVHHVALSPENGFALDLSLLGRALATGCDALYLCNPGNPTSRLYPLSLVERVMALCRDAGVFLVLDEAFMDFCEDASAKRLVAATDKAIILRSMTKFYAIPGLRLGYAIGNGELVRRLDACAIPWSVNTPALVAGLASLHDLNHRDATLRYVRQERTRLLEQLAGFPLLRVYPGDANFLLVEIRGDMTARELQELLMGERIVIRDCGSFVGLTPHFFRVAVRTREENERLAAGVERSLKTA